MKRILLAAVLSAGLFAQRGLDPATLLKVPTDSWPSYNGDYSGRRYSPLTKINASNIKSLGLSWLYRLNTGIGGGGTIKATPLMVNGVLYFTVPDHAWAVDARTGRELWHYRWESKGGIHIGNRGVGIYGNWLYFETPDCHLVSLNIKDGSERWRKVICDLDQMYFGSVAPVVVGNHVIVGVSGDDLDIPDISSPATRRPAISSGAGTSFRRIREIPVRDLAQRRSGPSRRRHDLDSRHLRPGVETVLHRYRKSAASARRQRTPGRQSVHRVDCRDSCRDGQDGLVSPTFAARYA